MRRGVAGPGSLGVGNFICAGWWEEEFVRKDRRRCELQDPFISTCLGVLLSFFIVYVLVSLLPISCLRAC